MCVFVCVCVCVCVIYLLGFYLVGFYLISVYIEGGGGGPGIAGRRVCILSDDKTPIYDLDCSVAL